MQLTPEQRESVIDDVEMALFDTGLINELQGFTQEIEAIADAAINAILSIACPPGVEGVAGASDGAPSLPPYDWDDVDVGEPIAVVDGLPIHNSFLRQDGREAMALILKRDITGKAVFPPTRVPSQIKNDPANYQTRATNRENFTEDGTGYFVWDKPGQRCKWTHDESGYWETGCHGGFTFEAGAPIDNGFAFCPYCGKPLEVIE